MDEENITVEEFKKIGEALKQAKKYMHIFLELAQDANLDIDINKLKDVQMDFVNASYDIGRQMQAEYPEELEVAYDLFF